MIRLAIFVSSLFLENKKLNSLRELEKISPKVKKEKPKGTDYSLQKKNKSINNRLAKTETEIADLERELKAIDLELQRNYDQTISKLNFFESYDNKKKLLVELMKKWEDLVSEIEALNKS